MNEKQTESIEFSPIFNKKLAKAPSEVKSAVVQALELFGENHNHKALRNHPLRDKYAGLRSIDVTDDWRALYRSEKERILFIDLGTHDHLLYVGCRPQRTFSTINEFVASPFLIISALCQSMIILDSVSEALCRR